MTQKSVYEYRVDNLGKLVEKYEGQRPLCDAAHIAQTQVSSILAWTPGTTNRFHKRMGERLARRLEVALQLPQYWMDMPHDEGSLPGVKVLSSDQATVGKKTSSSAGTLTAIQAATRDTMEKLMVSGKLPDSACLKLLQGWQSAVEELEASTHP